MRYKAGQTVDHYEIVEALGEGSYAETYKARDQQSGSIVMLKSPNPQMFADPHIYQRFRRESEIARRLDAPGIQRSLDLHDTDGDPYLVLEYVDGESLRRQLAEQPERNLPIALALDWGRQLAVALAYLHSRGVTHRDLKPENIVVATDGKLKVVDYGAALLSGARRLTWRYATDSVGTADYMSPEQIQGKRGDPRSDIYAWGVILYELLTGHVPFGGDNYLAAMAGHLLRDPKRPREVRRDVPPALEAVVLKAMRRYPEHRYQSAEALLADLDNLASLDPSAFDLGPEAPMGGLGVASSEKQLWLLIALIALGFVALVTVIIVITAVVR